MVTDTLRADYHHHHGHLLKAKKQRNVQREKKLQIIKNRRYFLPHSCLLLVLSVCVSGRSESSAGNIERRPRHEEASQLALSLRLD